MNLWWLVGICCFLVGPLPGALSFVIHPTDPSSRSAFSVPSHYETTKISRSTIRLQAATDSTNNRHREADERIQDYHSDSDGNEKSMPLCDLQTLLRLAKCASLDTGGSAKVAIQAGECSLNGAVETRRSKKLFSGDVVSFRGVDYSVDQIVVDKNYEFKPKKQKKKKPEAKIDEFGNKEFGGRYRSEEWRAERKQKKADRKSQNAAANKQED